MVPPVVALQMVFHVIHEIVHGMLPAFNVNQAGSNVEMALLP